MAALYVEAIWEALAARLEANVTGFTKVTRRRKVDPSPEELPFLLVLDDDGDEVLLTDPRDPAPAWRLSGQLVIVAKAQPADIDGKPTANLNALVKVVREALERQPSDPIGPATFQAGFLTFYTDLGGKLSSFAITKVEKGAGDKAGTSIAILHVEMETNPA